MTIPSGTKHGFALPTLLSHDVHILFADAVATLVQQHCPPAIAQPNVVITGRWARQALQLQQRANLSLGGQQGKETGGAGGMRRKITSSSGGGGTWPWLSEEALICRLMWHCACHLARHVGSDVVVVIGLTASNASSVAPPLASSEERPGPAPQHHHHHRVSLEARAWRGVVPPPVPPPSDEAEPLIQPPQHDVVPIGTIACWVPRWNDFVFRPFGDSRGAERHGLSSTPLTGHRWHLRLQQLVGNALRLLDADGTSLEFTTALAEDDEKREELLPSGRLRPCTATRRVRAACHRSSIAPAADNKQPGSSRGAKAHRRDHGPAMQVD